MLDTGIVVDGQMDGAGVGQGGIVDTPDGDWYAPLFQDHGAVGRVPMLVKVTWEDEWPVFSIDPTMDMPVSGQDEKSIVVSDEFYNGEEKAPYLNSEADIAANTEAAASVLSAQTAVAAAPTAREPKELIVNGGFEDGTDGWELRTFNGTASMEATSDDKASGASSLLVYDKANTTSGPMQNLTGKVQPGQKLHISAKVKYTTGPDVRKFNVTMQYGENDFAGTDPAAGYVDVTKGEWNTIEADYTVPKDAELSRVLVFVETSWTAEQDPEHDRKMTRSVQLRRLNGRIRYLLVRVHRHHDEHRVRTARQDQRPDRPRHPQCTDDQVRRHRPSVEHQAEHEEQRHKGPQFVLAEDTVRSDHVHDQTEHHISHHIQQCDRVTL